MNLILNTFACACSAASGMEGPGAFHRRLIMVVSHLDGDFHRLERSTSEEGLGL